MEAIERDIDASDQPESAGAAPLSTSSPANRGSRQGSPSIWWRIRRDVLLLGAGSLGTVVGQLVFRSILIAVLVPADYGRLSLVLSIYNTVWIIGASGLPNGVARYIAMIAPADDSRIVRSAFRAGVWPTFIAAVLVAAAAGLILNSALAFVFGAIGLSCMVYAVIITGILRGRSRMGFATAILPLGGVSELLMLIVVLACGLSVTPVSAFGVFCVGNVVGLAFAMHFMMRTAPPKAPAAEPEAAVLNALPDARKLLGFSMWLGAAAVGVAILPLTVRFAAALSSYTIVALVDVALVLLSIPLRMGSVIVSAVIPHATRALNRGDESVTISLREQLLVIVPFVAGAGIVAFTPLVGWLFDAIGRPEYAKSSAYLALALLAGPARVLYGLVEGVLVARGDGRFLAFNSLSVAGVASIAIILAAALGSVMLAFSLFVVACWAVYVCGLRRISS